MRHKSKLLYNQQHKSKHLLQISFVPHKHKTKKFQTKLKIYCQHLHQFTRLKLVELMREQYEIVIKYSKHVGGVKINYI